MERYKLFKNKEKKSNLSTLREQQKFARDNKRLHILEELRNLNEVSEPKPVVVKKKTRLEQLKEWQQKKQLLSKENTQQKKKPFVVGVIKRKATGSPDVAGPVPLMKAGVTTRAMSKKVPAVLLPKPLQRPPMKQLKALQGSSMKPIKKHAFAVPKAVAALNRLTVPISPQITKSGRKRAVVFENKSSEPEAVIVPETAALPDPVPQKKTRLNLLEKLDSLKEDKETETVASAEESAGGMSRLSTRVDCIKKRMSRIADEERITYTPEQDKKENRFQHLEFSPYIETRRGSGPRSSGKRKAKTLEEKVENEIAAEDREKNRRIHEFRLFLSNETSRLLSLGEKWSKFLMENPETPTDVEGDVNAVVGKTKLLTSDKFKQFEGLVDRFVAGDSQIKLDDLQGFHDWVCLEIEDLDKVYFGLEDRQKTNWEMKEVKKVALVEEKPKPKTVAVRKPVASKKPSGVSSMRAHILAARMKMKEGTTSSPPKTDPSAVPSPAKPISPVATRTPTPSTPMACVAPASVLSPRHLACLSPRTPNIFRMAMSRCSGLEIMNATNLLRRSLTPKLNREDVPEFASASIPTKSILKKKDTPLTEKKSVGFKSKRLIDPSYLMPSEASPKIESPCVLDLVGTPLRRSSRLARKSILFT